MKIGIDGRSLETNAAGIGRYVYELCKCLDRLIPEAEFFLYTRGPLDLPLISERWKYRHEKNPLFRKVKSIAWLRWFSGKLCSEDAIDVYWGGATFVPLFLPRNTKTISTVHDLNHLLVPETMPLATYVAYKLFFSSDIRRADIVITNSIGTKTRLKELCGVVADFVVTPGVAPMFRNREVSEISAVRKKYNIGSDPYILALSTLEPRKNLKNLLLAFINQKYIAGFENHKIVLAGGIGWKNQELEALLARAPNSVLRCGYVEDSDLPALYSGADFFVFPSVYEGFGIPVLEAVACGTPVLASNIPEILEAAQGHGIFVGPDVAEIQGGLVQALKDYAVKRQHSFGLVDTDWNSKGHVYASAIMSLFSRSRHK